MKHVLWTGGFDSTYVVMKLLWEGHEVQPIYLSSIDRRSSEAVELHVMSSITAHIQNEHPEYNLLIKNFIKREVKKNEGSRI